MSIEVCHDCPRRRALCHATCERYKLAKAEHEEQLRSLHKVTRAAAELYAQRRDGVDKALHRKGRR